ncbi:PREDICTED: ornithine decarboxylase 2-like [Elephantulus edwardii]|uniref:ornithine decarboxylase 2-like n=1 Tax=Elephantulus edwardii TaxID=28737 RepID=UPI0003F0A8DD|nr:PREDICTED: ornithine decarboxylase 2-like [Elephantulus edwardii]
MQQLGREEDLVGVLEPSVLTQSTWPKELIPLGPGDSALQVVLQKIQELSNSEHRDPFMVADLGVLVHRHQTFIQSMPQVSPFYAVKCNNNPWVLRVLAALGTGFDCASQMEMELVLGLGVTPSRIIYAHPCKPISHIQYAARHRVQLLTFDSEEELVKVAQHHPSARLVLRLKTQDKGSSFPFSTKFGASLEVCEHLLTSARDLGLAVVGVSFHVGSECHMPESYTEAIADSRCVFEMGRRTGHNMDLLDIGGGFPGVEGVEPTFEEFSRVINAALAKDFTKESDVRIIAEPGRFYAASVFTSAVNIIAKKAVQEPGGNRKLVYYLNEGLYGSFRMFIRERLPKIPIVVKELSSEAPLFSCTLYGPTCDSYDKISMEEVQLPELDVGDWLIFPSTGAYTSTMSSCFNGFPPASICYALSPEISRSWGKSPTSRMTLTAPPGARLSCARAVLRTGGPGYADSFRFGFPASCVAEAEAAEGR